MSCYELKNLLKTTSMNMYGLMFIYDTIVTIYFFSKIQKNIRLF